MTARRFALCASVIDIGACGSCKRNPEAPGNASAQLDPAQQWRKPMATETACGDWLPEHKAPQ